MGVQPRRFTGKRIPELFLEDVGRYEALARELGATDVRVVGKKDVILDERVIARCYSPRCCYYGTNLNCPPHGPGIEEMRRVVDRYDTGLFLRMDVPPEEVADPDYDNPDKHKIPGARKMFEIVAKIQSAAYYDGYPFALGFGGGPSCKRVFCGKVDCSGIAGKGCRFHLKSNMTMHGVGMDVFSMAARAGWDIYPIGKACCPQDIPHGLELGLVLVD
jgi:predicted metal-binding protein